jgi:hypothetical protein
MVVSCHQKAGQNNSLLIANKFFENLALLEKLTVSQAFPTTVTNQNYIHEEIKSRLSLRTLAYRSVQILLSSCLLSRNIKIKMYKTVILPVVCVCVCVLNFVPNT